MAHADDNGSVEVNWNGRDVPAEFSHLPPGRYRVEPVNEWDLSPEEEAGLEAAVAALDRGDGISNERVEAEMKHFLSAKL